MGKTSVLKLISQFTTPICYNLFLILFAFLMAILIFYSFFILGSWLHFPSNETSSGLQWSGFPFLLFCLFFLSAADRFRSLWSENIHVPAMQLTQNTGNGHILATWPVTNYTNTKRWSHILSLWSMHSMSWWCSLVCYNTRYNFSYLFFGDLTYPTFRNQVLFLCNILEYLWYTFLSLKKCEMYLHRSPILLYGSGKSVLPGYCFNIMWVWYFILEKQWSSVFLPNVIILKRHWRKSELHNKFSILHYIYSFIMIIIYYLSLIAVLWKSQ